MIILEEKVHITFPSFEVLKSLTMIDRIEKMLFLNLIIRDKKKLSHKVISLLHAIAINMVIPEIQIFQLQKITKELFCCKQPIPKQL